MPAIVATAAGSQIDPLVRASTRTTLGATGNTLTYAPGQGGWLILHNATAGALSPTIIGGGAVSTNVNQVGTVNYAAGYAVGSIAATTGQVCIPLISIDPYLRGTIDITGGTGLVATLLTVS